MLYSNIAREPITPPLGTCLFGYEPGIEAYEINDDINVTAVYFTDENNAIMFINADVCLIANEIHDQIKVLVSEVTGLPKESIITAADHTHSAPNVSGQKGWYNDDK